MGFFEMVIEILDGGEILVNYKFKLNNNLNLNFVPRDISAFKSKNHTLISIRLCERFDFLDFDSMTKRFSHDSAFRSPIKSSVLPRLALACIHLECCGVVGVCKDDSRR